MRGRVSTVSRRVGRGGMEEWKWRKKNEGDAQQIKASAKEQPLMNYAENSKRKKGNSMEQKFKKEIPGPAGNVSESRVKKVNF